MLGSHRFICDDLDAAGTPLAPLPFIGAVYRTGHAESYIGSRTILKQYFLRKDLLKAPREIVRRASRLKLKNRRIEKEFFGFASKTGLCRACTRRCTLN